jgi:hypothetical protein
MKRLTPDSTWWHRLPHMDHIGIDVHKKESA